MSRGQKPRWSSFYPRMKQRGKHRKKYGRIVFWSGDWKPYAWYKTTERYPFTVSGNVQERNIVVD